MNAASRRLPTIAVWERWLVLLAGALCLVAIAVNCSLLLSDSASIRGIENNIAVSVNYLLTDRPLYPAPEMLPLGATQYGPLHYQLTATLAQVLGVDAGQADRLYLLDRGRSVLSTLVLAGLAAGFALRQRAGATIALLVASSVLVWSFPWYGLTRPDATSALFGFLALYAYSKHLGQPVLRHLLWCAGWLALALLFKQSGIYFAAVIAAHLLLRGQFAAMLWVPLAAVALFCGWFLLFPQTLGAGAIGNMLAALSNGVSLNNLAMKVVPFSLAVYGMLLALWLTLLFWLAVRIGWRPLVLLRYARRDFLVFASLAMLGVSALASFKLGAAENYFIEWAVLASLALLLRIAHLKAYRLPAQFFFAVMLACVIVPQYARYASEIYSDDHLSANASHAAQLRQAFGDQRWFMVLENGGLEAFVPHAFDVQRDVTGNMGDRFVSSRAAQALDASMRLVVVRQDDLPSPAALDWRGRELQRVSDEQRLCAGEEQCIRAAEYVLAQDTRTTASAAGDN